MKKKLLFLAIVASFTLTACGGKDSLTSSEISLSDSGETSSTDSMSNETSSFDTSSEDSSSEVEIRYYDLTVMNGTGSQTHVEEGTLVTVIADEPDAGKEFVGWENADGEIVSTESTFSFTLTENTILTATYSLVDVTLVVHNGTGSNTYKYGDSVTVIADEPDTGKTFSGWRDTDSDTIISTSPSYTFTITKNLELSAEYTDLILHVTVNNGTGSGDYKYGTVITITANPAEPGTAFKCFINDDDGSPLSQEEEFELTITEDMVITAVYTTLNYTVTVVGGIGGKDYFLYGDECTITANDVPGKVFSGWEDEEGTIVSTDNPYTFTVTKDITLTATYDDAMVIGEPETYDDVVNIISTAALVENNLETMSFVNQTDSGKETNVSVTFYKDGLVAEGSGPYSDSSYASIYDLTHSYQVKNGKLFEVLDSAYPYSSSYDKAVAKSMVESVNDSDLEILSSDATGIIDNFGAISKLSVILGDFAEDATMNVEHIDGRYNITFTKVLPNETSTLYGTFDLEIVVNSSDNFVTSYSYHHKRYVISTMVENGELKADATPRDNIYTIVEASKSDTELENMPEDVASEKIDNYFISDFTFRGSYYQNNTSRSFTSENPLVAAGYSITNWTMSDILPTTSIESKTLYFLSSSDEDVITINTNKKGITTIAEGTSQVVVSTSAGVTKTVTFTVGQLPPASISISCADKVVIGETIELTATVTPTDSVETVNWSVNDINLAEIVTEDGKTMLKGKASGFVTVTATSTADESILATKSVFVSAGDLTDDQLKESLVGTWQIIMNSYSNTGFTFTFKEDGTVIVVDTYRGTSAKISCNATWTLTHKSDSEKPHNGTYYTLKGDDYYVIEIDVIEMTDSPSYMLYDFHLAIAKDGSGLTYHFIPGSSSASTQEGNLLKIA